MKQIEQLATCFDHFLIILVRNILCHAKGSKSLRMSVPALSSPQVFCFDVNYTICIPNNCRHNFNCSHRLLLGHRCVVVIPCFVHTYETMQKIIRTSIEQHQTFIQNCHTNVFEVFVSNGVIYFSDSILVPKWKTRTLDILTTEIIRE